MEKQKESMIDQFHTFKAKTVLQPFSMHLVTAPPAPSPRPPSSITRFSMLAILHPSSSSSSTDAVRAFSRVSLSKASSPCKLPSRSFPTPPGPSLRSEYIDPTADTGSGVPCGRPIPYWLDKDSAQYCDPAEVGLLAFPSRGPKLPERLCAALLSLPPDALWPGCATEGRPGACSCGVAVVPMGVARWRIGSGGRLPGPMLEPRGFTFGDGMERPRRGVRAPLDERAPGMAGRSSGAGLDIIGIGLAAAAEGFFGERSMLVSVKRSARKGAHERQVSGDILRLERRQGVPKGRGLGRRDVQEVQPRWLQHSSAQSLRHTQEKGETMINS